MPMGIGTPEVDIGTAGPILFLIILTPYGPTIAGFVVSALSEGRSGVRSLWGRFWNRNIHLRWLLVIVFFFPALRVAANLVSRLLDRQDYPFLTHPGQIWMFIPPLIANTIINGGMSEEFGWRGFALPRFQARWNALASSIILGAIWASWHIPLWFVPGDTHNQVYFWGWAGRIILFSIMMTWIFNNTKGSVLAAILFHGFANASGDIIWCCGSSEWHFNGTYLVIVILILIIFGPKHLVRKRAAGKI